jgi:hypothetical protein
VPFEGLERAAHCRAVAAATASSSDGVPFRVSHAWLSRLWVRDPALPLAVSPASRCLPCARRRSVVHNPAATSRRVPPPNEYYPATPSRLAEANRRLPWAFAPYSTCRLEGPRCSRACHTRHVPPSGFGYPLDGFRPSRPRQLYLAPAALLGLPLRSLLLPRGPDILRCRPNPPGVQRIAALASEADEPAPCAPPSGLCPARESLALRPVLPARSAGCSLGVRPPEVFQNKP